MLYGKGSQFQKIAMCSLWSVMLSIKTSLVPSGLIQEGILTPVELLGQQHIISCDFRAQTYDQGMGTYDASPCDMTEVGQATADSRNRHKVLQLGQQYKVLHQL